MITGDGKLALSEEKLNDAKLLIFEWVNENVATETRSLSSRSVRFLFLLFIYFFL